MSEKEREREGVGGRQLHDQIFRQHVFAIIKKEKEKKVDEGKKENGGTEYA